MRMPPTDKSKKTQRSGYKTVSCYVSVSSLFHELIRLLLYCASGNKSRWSECKHADCHEKCSSSAQSLQFGNSVWRLDREVLKVSVPMRKFLERPSCSMNRTKRFTKRSEQPVNGHRRRWQVRGRRLQFFVVVLWKSRQLVFCAPECRLILRPQALSDDGVPTISWWTIIEWTTLGFIYYFKKPLSNTYIPSVIYACRSLFSQEAARKEKNAMCN